MLDFRTNPLLLLLLRIFFPDLPTQPLNPCPPLSLSRSRKDLRLKERNVERKLGLNEGDKPVGVRPQLSGTCGGRGGGRGRSGGRREEEEGVRDGVKGGSGVFVRDGDAVDAFTLTDGGEDVTGDSDALCGLQELVREEEKVERGKNAPSPSHLRVGSTLATLEAASLATSLSSHQSVTPSLRKRRRTSILPRLRPQPRTPTQRGVSPESRSVSRES
jgi:hypothetical protein